MGNVTTSLRISSADVLSTSVDINVLANLNADSGTLSRAKVVKTAVDANALEVYTLNDKTESAYLYLRNMEADKENYVYIYNATVTNDAHIAKIGGGEFCFIPVQVINSYRVFATRVDSMVEFAIFGLDSSAAGPFNQS
tara:strand:+ start:2911 stop:3327 length:417 start_codon:yes stop_codon:yes gene_type:complete